MKNSFRVVGMLEGFSLLLLLFVAMPMKYIWGNPEYVRSVGMAHGILFIVYVLLATLLSSAEKWTNTKLLLAYVLSSVPFGTFYFERKIL